jgi:putative hydrolase
MRPIADFHTHTRWSHASGSIADNLRAAEQIGLKELGIAEHGPNLLFVGVPRRKWPGLSKNLKENRQTGTTRLLFNIEANVVSTNGDIDRPASITKELDMLLVGLHPRVLPVGLSSYWAYYGLRWLALLSRSQRHRLYDTFSQAMILCVEKHKVDIITHPGYGLPIDTEELARTCARRGTKLEINCRHTDAIAKDIAIAAKVSQIEFVIGSDAHHPGEVGRFEAGYRLIKALRIDRERIKNVDWQDNTY